MKNAIKRKSSHKSPFNKEISYLEDFKKIINSNANHGLCGSMNLGNTCYMNSSIACLSNCYELTAYFLLEKYIDDVNENNVDGAGGELAKSWYNLLNYYWNSSNKVGNPKSIKSIVGSKKKKFLGDKQQDSNEFMTLFLEILGEDLNRANKKIYVELKEQQKDESDMDAANRFWDLHIKRNDSIVTDLFHGLLKSTIICPKCEFKNITYDPFNTLTLTIPSIDEISHFQYKKRKKIKIVKRKKEIANIYYVPAFSLMSTVKFEIEIYKDMSLNEIVEQIIERGGEDIRISNNLKFISVSNKKFQKYLNPQKPIKGNRYTFGYEKEVNANNYYSVPFYLSLDEKFSAYPRILFLPRNTSFYEFKKKIYFFMRKYIKCPLNYSNDEYEEEKELIDYINGKYNKLHNVLSLLEEEFDLLHKNNKYSKYYTKSPPYLIILSSFKKNEEEYIINKGKDNNYQILSMFNIDSDDKNVDEFIEYILDNEINLVVEIISKSIFIKENISFDKCFVEKIPPLKEEEKEEYEEIEYEEEESQYTNSKKSNNITLDHCLKSFTEEEYLGKGNEWYCNKCRKRVMASKQIELFYLPRIMCICLNRFLKKGRFNDYTKNNSFVDFPLENLNMEKYMCGPDKKFSKYDLFAVSQHFGGMGGGHYTAICKNIDGKWYEYDDRSCMKALKSDVCSNAAYVLFYRRKNW